MAAATPSDATSGGNPSGRNNLLGAAPHTEIAKARGLAGQLVSARDAPEGSVIALRDRASQRLGVGVAWHKLDGCTGLAHEAMT